VGKTNPNFDPKEFVDGPTEGGEPKEQLDPLEHALYISDIRDREDLADISSRVRWVTSSTAPSYEKFQQAKALAMMDEFSDFDCSEKKSRLQALGMDTSNSRCLEIFRRTQYFKETRDKILAARDRIRQPMDLDQRIEEGAHEAFDALNRMTIHGRGKERYMAAREFTDRAAPKTLTGPGAHSVVISMEVGGQLIKALDTLKKKGYELDSAPEVKQIGGNVE